MTLLVLRKASISDSYVIDKPLGVLQGQMLFATNEGDYHTPWIDLATYSSIANRAATSRYKYDWRKLNKYDAWGRIQRTEFWQ